MPTSQAEARAELEQLLAVHGQDAAWVARRIGRTYLWVWRRLVGKTRIQMDDRELLLSAFGPDTSK